MYTIQPKKMIILNILDILQKYTDENHRLSQKDICDILSREYMMKVDRKTVKTNILNLISAGYNIEYSETPRRASAKCDNTEENTVMYDFYLNRSITDSELRLLIDGLLFSKHIPQTQCKELIKKLENLSSKHFRSGADNIATFPEDRTDNKQLFYNIELADEAIRNKKKISFQYLEYGTDKKMHKKKNPDGTPREYLINPYHMAANDGKYYLICNNELFDDISNYRLDRMTEMKIQNTALRPVESLKGQDGRPLDLQKYMQEHIYMFSSETVHAKFRITKSMIGNLFDLIGKNVTFSEETETHVTVTATVNEMAMQHFAKSFASRVVVLEPERLADNVKAYLRKAIRNYNEAEREAEKNKA